MVVREDEEKIQTLNHDLLMSPLIQCEKIKLIQILDHDLLHENINRFSVLQKKTRP